MRSLVRLLTGMLVAALVAGGGQALARSWTFQDPHDSSRNYIEPEAWKEQEAVLPDYPAMETLLELNIGGGASGHSYAIDPASISVGEDDVVHYTLVRHTASGLNNVTFEGIHCVEKSYKTLAYGTRERSFRMLRRPQWRAIDKRGSGRYRYALWDHYLCAKKESLQRSRSREEILDAIKYNR